MGDAAFVPLRGACGLMIAGVLCAGCGRHTLSKKFGDAGPGAWDASAIGDASAREVSVRDSRGSDVVRRQCTPVLDLSGAWLPPQLPYLPSAIAVADLDGDGVADIVATFEKEDSLVIFPGCGNGSFGEGLWLPTSRGPVGVVIDDVNADKNPDLIVSNYSANTVSVFLGQSGGVFGPAIDTPLGKQPRDLVTGDFNGDGKRDLAVAYFAEESTGAIALMQSERDGGFSPLTTYPIETTPQSLATGDLDGDGRDELAMTGWGNTPVIVLSWGNGMMASRRDVGDVANSVVIGDLNRDGHLDLAWSTGRGVQIGLNPGNGKFTQITGYNAGPVEPCPSYSLTLGNVTGNDAPDLLVLNDDCQVFTSIPNHGDGTFTQPNTIDLEDYPYLLATGDLDQDGKADLVIATGMKYLSILLAQTDGGFAPPSR